MTHYIKNLVQVEADELSAIDLREDAAQGIAEGRTVECYRAWINVDGEDAAEALEVLLMSDRVAQVAWGSDATCLEDKYLGRDGAEQAIDDYFHGQEDGDEGEDE